MNYQCINIINGRDLKIINVNAGENYLSGLGRVKTPILRNGRRYRNISKLAKIVLDRSFSEKWPICGFRFPISV